MGALLVLVGGPLAVPAQDVGLTVRQLRFEGNHSINSEQLEAAISTTNSSWFATSVLRFTGLGEKRSFSEREFQRDLERLKIFYRRSGFLDVSVDTVVRRTREDVYVTFRIREGEPVRVSSLAITGLDTMSLRNRILRDLPLVVGRVFNRDSLVATADTITSRLRDRGYPTATVFLQPFDGREAAITLNVEPGQSAVIGDIRVVGVETVDSSTVVELLATEVGRPYRLSDLFTSQQNLYRSDLFRYATVAIDTARFRVGDPFVPLLVQVIQGRLRRVRASTGFGSNDCFRLGLGWTARDFPGHGQILDLSGQLSKIGVGAPFGFGAEDTFLCSRLAEDSIGSLKANFSLSASLKRPAFVSPANTLTFTAFAERRSEFAVYLRNEVGASVIFHRQTAGRVPMTLSYRVSFGRTEADAVSFCSFFNACTPNDITELRKRRVLATVTGTIVRERTNNPLDPTRGNILSAETTVSSHFIGSSRLQTFTRVLGEASAYRPIGPGIVLAVRAQGGALFAPRVALDEGTTNFIPPDQRFYAGGPTDVRGYNRNQLGPVAYVIAEDNVIVRPGEPDSIPADRVQVAPTGGNTLLIANIELRFPSPLFGDRFRLASFVDAGAVWERGARAVARVLRVTPGMGIRIATPLGPARLDVAYNPYDLPEGALFVAGKDGTISLLQDRFQGNTDRSPWTLHFSVGQAF